ncbi:hypothetical protein ABPG74_000354 [Tetrahymena malaccensis]
MTEADERILRYGQIILLRFFDDENGFISADGHVKKHVQMKSYDSKYLSIKRSQQTEGVTKDDFSNCLFQVFPKVVNTQKSKIIKEIDVYKKQKQKEENKDELTKEKLQMFNMLVEAKDNQNKQKGKKDKEDKDKDKDKNALNNFDEEDDKDQFLKRISKHQIYLQNEYKYNVDTFENNKNQPVNYNQPFQLLHLNSSKFLSCNSVESKWEKENYEISLEEFCTDSTLFKIIPAFKYQKDSSNAISEGDCIMIIRALPFNNKTIHLHCSMELMEMKKKTQMQKQLVHQTFQGSASIMYKKQEVAKMQQQQQYEQQQKQQQLQQQQGSDQKNQKNDNQMANKIQVKIQKREINGCLETATPLKFQIYQEVTDTKSRYLNCGDAIWLHHSEANSALSVIRKERGTTRYTFTALNIEQWISQQNLEIFVAQNKESQSFEDYSGNTFGLWIIENVDFKKGGYVEYGVGYRLKHMPTGYYLTVIDENLILMEQKLKQLEQEKIDQEKKKSEKNTKQINRSFYDDQSEKSDNEEEKHVDFIVENDKSDINLDTSGNQGYSSGDDSPMSQSGEQKTTKRRRKKKVNKEAELIKQKQKMAKKWKLSLTKNANDPFTLFQFFALGTSPSIFEQFVEAGNFIFIRNMESKQWIDVINLLNSNQQENADIPTQMKNFENQNQLSTFDQNESVSAFSPLRAVLKNEQAENQVFKVFSVSSNEVWEAKFVISCSNVLIKFLVNQKNLNQQCELGDEISIRKAKEKIKISRECINNLNNFCSNKLLNYQQEQKFGAPNARRQRLLREQYYIDFLVKILEDLLPKNELETWVEYKQIMDKERKELEEEEDQEDNSDDSDEYGNGLGGIKFGSKKKKSKANKTSKLSNKKDHAFYLKEKVNMAKDIYLLLASLCKNNETNEEYTYKLIPFFQIHCKYIPEAIDCIISLVSNNEKILMTLSENLKIDFDYEKKDEGQTFQGRQVKILINMYDQDNTKHFDQSEEKIPFRQHEKITTKPINLIVFFMNLIWDDNSKLNSNYLKFLRSICRIQNKAISLNQENIFKIFKKYSQKRNAIRYDQYFKSGSIKLPELGRDPKQFENDVSEQLKFYSELSYGRNFLWRKELIAHFSNYYLLQNIWSQGDLKDYPILRSCFCQLAMSLYIDHEPLQRQNLPNYCRLFERIGDEISEKIFDEEKNQENEIAMYKNLLNGLENYLRGVSNQIQDLIIIYKRQKDRTNREMEFKMKKRGQSILQDPLLLNSMELLYLLIELNLFGALNKTDSYKDFMPFLQNILVYDLKNLEYFTACAYTLQLQNQARKEKKKDKNKDLLNISSGFSTIKNLGKSLNKSIIGGGDTDDIDEEIDYELDSQELVNPLEQSKLYDNHIMRGQIKLHNQLEEMNYSDSIGYQTEIKVKLKVLDILEYFMDLRHDYLMTNMLKFFKDNISNVGKDLDYVQTKKKILQITKDHVKGFLPNIPLTGIDSVDKIFQYKQDGSFKLDFKISLNKKKSKDYKDKFHGYISKKDYIHYQDFNNLLSAAIEQSDSKKQEDLYENPIATLLPSLLSSFLIIYDENLEKRLLKILIRMYNQRYDLLENISRLQIIFDKQTYDLFNALEDMNARLHKYVEQCEVWFTTFAQKAYKDHFVSHLITLLDNLNNGFFKCYTTADGEIILLEQSKKRENQKVDKEKQKIFQYLKIHEPIIELLNEGMHHFDSFILKDNYPADKKAYLIKLFELVYEFLIYFTQDCRENQAIIKNYIPMICRYLKYDLGQTTLICSIYKDNIDLLTNIDKQLIETFLDLIENEGRQIQFLDIFEIILKIKNKYIFDNQLLILNTFLPQKELTEKEYNLLYANGSNQKSLTFYLDDVCKSLEKQKLDQKLKDVEYRDTFRDEPFQYHMKILNLLIQTSYISTNQNTKEEGEETAQQSHILSNQAQSDSHPSKLKKGKTFKVNDYDLALQDIDEQGEEDAEEEEDQFGEIEDEEQDGNDKKVSIKDKKKQKINAYMEKLKQFSKSDHILQDSKFNILVTRLKRVFKVNQLLQMLQQEDSYADWSKFSNEINQKPEDNQQLKDTQGKKGLFQEALADKEEIERKRQIEEKKKKYLSQHMYQDSEFVENRKQFKKGMSLLKPHLLNFLRKVHIQSETVISSVSEMITNQKEIAYFLDKEGLKVNCIKEGVFSENYVEYIFDYLLPFLYDYHKKFIQRGPHNMHIQEDEERKDEKSLEFVVDKILSKLPIFTPYLSHTQKERTTLIIKSIKGLNTKVKFEPLLQINLNSKMSSHIKSPTKGEKVNMFKDLLQSKAASNPAIEEQGDNPERNDAASDNNDDETKLLKGNTISLKSKIKSKLGAIALTSQMVVENQSQQAQLAERNWQIFKIILKEEDFVIEQVQKEKIALAEAIVRVKKIVKKEYGKDLSLKPDMFKLIKKFIKFLLYAPEDPNNKETIISLISVLKEIIDSKGIKDRSEDEIDEEKDNEKREKIQNMFDQLGAMKMILMVLSQNNRHLDNELIIHYLSFANTLLEGGNNQIQNTIYSFFMSYQKSEVIFSRFNSIIRKQIRNIEHKSNIGTGDAIEMEEENSQMIELLERVLRFLQLCVEGHYINLQNYLRKQDNSRNNYDMVQAVADLLKAYYYGDCTQKMYDNMIFCLDTLSEFVQGPCKENQDAVSDSKFFDIASDLFSKKPLSEEAKQRKRDKKKKDYRPEEWKKMNLIEQYRKSKDQPLTEWMKGRLQNKVLILVLSLLESREVKSNCEIIKRIMRNLPLYVLQRHLIKIYKRFDILYQNKLNRSSLSHMEYDPRKESDLHFFKKLHSDEKDIDEYLECILQNGFQIYFLLSYYIESDQKLGGEMVKIYKNYEKKILNNDKNELESLLTGDNMVGQLISFARSLIESVYRYVDAVKQKTVEAVKNQIKIADSDDKKSQAKQAAKISILKKAMNFFASNSAHIDIVRNEMLELVYFIRLPPTNCLPKEVKTEFHERCDRSNIKTKQSELIKESDDIIEICKHEYNLQILFSSNKFLALFANYVKLWKDLSFYISLVLNFFIIFSFSTTANADFSIRIDDYNLFDSPNYTLNQTRRIFRVLGIVMIVCSNFVLLFFLFKNVPLIFQRTVKSGAQIKDHKSLLGKLYVVLIKFLQIMYEFLQDFQVLYYIAYGTLAIIGTVINPFFFTFHLSAILMRFQTLKNVIMSIYMPRKQLLLTFMLFIILEYCFSVWGYSLYYGDYDDRCESLLYCFLTTFDQTFKPNGGVGGFLTSNPAQANVTSNTAKYSMSRFIFDQLFQYVLLNIMINIVVGIIIDTFGVLRETSNEQQEDMLNFCYVCGIERTTFDRKSDSGKGFIKHIKFNHYMWNYIHFIQYLEWKDRSEYTGIESYVDDLLKQNDTSWMPFKMAREILEGDSDDEEVDLSQLSQIQKKQKNLVKELNSLIEGVDDLAKDKKEKRK